MDDTRRRRLAAAALLVATLLVAGGLTWSGLGQPVAAKARPVLFQVRPGWSTEAIATALARRHLIRSPLYFVILVRLSNRAQSLKAGWYLLSPAASTTAIVQTLAAGKVAVRRVTIPEGFTVAEIARRLAAAGVCRAADFLAATKAFRNPYLPAGAKVANPMEGFLFPATYAIPYGDRAPDVVRLMFTTFQHRITPGEVARAKALGLSVDGWVTLASIVEREAKIPRERAIIAAVFLNRLRLGMPLQSDPTVLYALGRTADDLTDKDLAVDSPYNTYRYKGLPPGPIANPGQASLLAVLHPAHVGYLYFVGKPDGSHIFSYTYQQQLAAEAAVARLTQKGRK